MSKKRRRNRETDAQYAEDGISMDVVSSTEMTGMVPTPPLDDSEVEGYRSLFPVRQQAATDARKAGSPEEQERQSGKP